jgi:hypothetical protein
MQCTTRNYLAVLSGVILASSLAFGADPAVPDKYTVKVPGGLAFSEFRGYEGWQVVSTSQSDKLVAVILANPVMIEAYQAGIPGNGKPFPEGSKMAKIHWTPARQANFPTTTVPGALHDVDFMVKDNKRFPEGGWGYAMFTYEAATATFRPGTMADQPPQGNDAKCGVGCHQLAKAKDFVFTDYGPR